MRGERTRVVVAVKHPSGAPELLYRARLLATEGAKLWVVHVLEHQKDLSANRLIEQLERAEGWLRGAMSRSDLGAAALPLVVVGDPAEEILSAARALEADVVLLGAGVESDREGARPATGGRVQQEDVGRRVQAEAHCPLVFYQVSS